MHEAERRRAGLKLSKPLAESHASASSRGSPCQRSSTGITDARLPLPVSPAMELQPIAEESAKAAAASQQAAAAEAETHRRKVAVACGKRSESDDSDTAVLVAFATKRILRRDDLISVIHVSELGPLVLCALCNRAQRERESHASVRGTSGQAAVASMPRRTLATSLSGQRGCPPS